MTKLSQEQFSTWHHATRNLAIIEETVSKRFDYIVKTLVEIFKDEEDFKKFKFFKTWWFPNAQEGELGTPRPASGMIYFETEPNLKNNFIIIDRNEREWDVFESIPFRWLTEDFEAEVRAGIQKMKDRRQKDDAEKQRYAHEMQDNERRLYEQLKAKFEPKKTRKSQKTTKE